MIFFMKLGAGDFIISRLSPQILITRFNLKVVVRWLSKISMDIKFQGDYWSFIKNIEWHIRYNFNLIIIYRNIESRPRS